MSEKVLDGERLPWQVCVGNHDRLLSGIVHSVWTEGWYGYNLEHETYIVRIPPEWVQNRDIWYGRSKMVGRTKIEGTQSFHTC